MSQRLKELAFRDPEFQRQERENELGKYDDIVSRLEAEMPAVRRLMEELGDGPERNQNQT